MIPTYLFTLAFCLLSNISYAKKTIDHCESTQQTTSGLSSCFDIVKEAVDRELQTWINNQVFILEEFALSTGRRSALEMFKRSQRNFITFRENDCRWQYLAISPGKGAAAAFKKCYILVSRDRIKELTAINP
ncbi:MAG: DUF1311 domain-containing protein [Colwellia sp.]|nr:DUF1311 domain-containing protein [Colwellia sp.]